MLITERSVISNNIFSNYRQVLKKNGRKLGTTTAIVLLAQKRHLSENSSTQEQKKPSTSPLGVPNTILAQSAVAVFGLGFIDAGYSGDWSRIGVITKETEDLLKLAAFLVVPFCLFLIFSFSKKPEA